jgi:hypothetical protein
MLRVYEVCAVKATGENDFEPAERLGVAVEYTNDDGEKRVDFFAADRSLPDEPPLFERIA